MPLKKENHYTSSCFQKEFGKYRVNVGGVFEQRVSLFILSPGLSYNLFFLILHIFDNLRKNQQRYNINTELCRIMKFVYLPISKVWDILRLEILRKFILKFSDILKNMRKNKKTVSSLTSDRF